jgi:hypothetical protein
MCSLNLQSTQDLSSLHPADIAISLNTLSHIVTHDLSRDLSHELFTMLTHTRPHIRKRAVLVLYKVFLKYPEALKHGIGRLGEKLDDPDLGMSFCFRCKERKTYVTLQRRRVSYSERVMRTWAAEPRGLPPTRSPTISSSDNNFKQLDAHQNC